MGHAINYFVYKEKEINEAYADVNEWGSRESDYPDDDISLKLLNEIKDGKEEAENYLEQIGGRYYPGAVGVKFKNKILSKKLSSRQESIDIKLDEHKLKVKNLVNDMIDYARKHAISARKSKTCGCPNCESQVNVKYVRLDTIGNGYAIKAYTDRRGFTEKLYIPVIQQRCPVCQTELTPVLSPTTAKTLLRYGERIEEVYDKIIDLENKWKTEAEKTATTEVRWMVRAEVHC